MVVTIHQPEHFPYGGFYQKMVASDLFIILDNVNYRKNYYQNRNKLLNTNGIDEWFTIQVEKGATSKHIKDVNVVDGNWRKIIIKKLQQNFGIDLTDVYNHNKLIDINMESIEYCRHKLNINTPMVYASDLEISGSKSELLANLVNKVGGDVYLSGPSGRDYLELNYFNNINVEYFEPNVDHYYTTLQDLCGKTWLP